MGDAAPLLQDDPKYVAPKGDPHGDEVLEGGPPDPPEPETPPASETPPEPEAPPAPPVAEESPPAHKPDWRDKELGRRKRRLDEEVAAKEALAAENKRLTDLTESLSRQPPAEPAEGENPPPAPRPPPQGRVYTQAELDAEADRRAETKFKQATFQNDFASAVASANKAFGKDKVNEAIARISDMGGLDADHLDLILGTKDPGQVIFKLGSEPEEFQRIMDLPFNKRVAEFAEMALKTETPARQPSKTPPPVEPIGGGGGSIDNRYDDKADDAAWFAAEEKRSLAFHKSKRGY